MLVYLTNASLENATLLTQLFEGIISILKNIMLHEAKKG